MREGEGKGGEGYGGEKWGSGGGGRALNKDAETEVLFDERSRIKFMSTPHLDD